MFLCEFGKIEHLALPAAFDAKHTCKSAADSYSALGLEHADLPALVDLHGAAFHGDAAEIAEIPVVVEQQSSLKLGASCIKNAIGETDIHTVGGMIDQLQRGTSVPGERAFFESHKPFDLTELLHLHRIAGVDRHARSAVAVRPTAAECNGQRLRAGIQIGEMKHDAAGTVAVELAILVHDVDKPVVGPVRLHVDSALRCRTERIGEGAAAHRHAVHADRTHSLTVMIAKHKILKRDSLCPIHVNAVTS